MIQQEHCEIFKGLSNIFDIADDILIVGYNGNGRDHEKVLKWVIYIYIYAGKKNLIA